MASVKGPLAVSTKLSSIETSKRSNAQDLQMHRQRQRRVGGSGGPEAEAEATPYNSRAGGPRAGGYEGGLVSMKED